MHRAAPLLIVLLLLGAISSAGASTLPTDQSSGSAPAVRASLTVTVDQVFGVNWRWFQESTGKPIANAQVTLQRSKSGGSWTKVATGRTNAKGEIVFFRSESVQGTYRYRTLIGPVISPAHTVIVKTAPAGTADFAASPTSGKRSLGVQFADRSTGTPSGWRWEFGDGTTSTLKNPKHYYNRAGTYTVKLTVRYPNGASSAKTRTGYIRVTG